MQSSPLSLSLLWNFSAHLVHAQISASIQTTSFNSSFSLTSQQISEANFTIDEATSINNVINFERSQYAGGPTTEDEFYTLPTDINHTSLVPGTLLKVEDFTTLSNYTVAPNLALSRIIYTSTNLNGTSIPVSAFILWPFTPHPFPTLTPPNSAPVVLWNHMTSGFFSPAAPSKHRSLWAGDSAPFALALAGYAVVASDYAGLGVRYDFEGEEIPHQYLAMPAAANDAVYAFHAARSAFPNRLSKSYVVMGQSQGGGVAWGVSELLHRKPELADGYLGSISVSGTVEVFGGPDNYIGPFVGVALASVFPDFKLSDWLTPLGDGRVRVFKDVLGGLATGLAFFTTSEPIAQSGIGESWFGRAYSALADVGRKRVKGPLLVVQGSEDAFVPYAGVEKVVRETCELFPENTMKFVVSNGTGHVPTLDSSRGVWMRWIEERFEGRPVDQVACGQAESLESLLPVERYQKTWNSVPIWVGAEEYAYQQPLGL